MSDQLSRDEAERILKELESETLKKLEGDTSPADAPQMNSAVGRLSYIDAYQQAQVAMHARQQLEARLVSIRAALQRVKDGSYGRCVNCGVAILPARLEYMPETPYCTGCSERYGGG